jgi:DNA-binding MarR family transcriptional regulator
VSDLSTAGAALRRLVLACERYRHTAAAHLGLDPTQTQAVSHLHQSGDLGASELGALLGLNTSSITALLDRMEANNIARRSPHPTDRRRTVVQLTDHGHTLIADTAKFFYGAFDHIDPGHVPLLTQLLSALATDLEKHTGDMQLETQFRQTTN